MAKSLVIVLLIFQVSSITTLFAEKLETLPPTSPPHTSPPPLYPPTKSPVHPPAHPPHHHNHYHHSPAHPPHHHNHYHHSPAPSPSPIHSPSPPTHHQHHHHPPAPAPAPSHVKPPVHTPISAPPHSHVPVHPPVHSTVPVHPPIHSPVPVHPPVHSPVPVHPPVHSPVPVHPPVHSPVPVHPPVKHFPRSFIAVQGVVYLKSCKYAGVDTLLGATPLLGAVVKLQCNNTKYKLVQKDETDKNGYFFIEAPKSITTYGAHKCNVVLVTAPNGLDPSNLHSGVSGAVLKPEKTFVSKGLPFVLYTVGPLAFEPRCPKKI